MDPDQVLMRGHLHNLPNKKPRISPPATRPTEISQEESFRENNELEGMSDISEVKDEAEQKLESLIFGDQAAFHDALKFHDQKSNIHSSNFLPKPDFGGDSCGDDESDGGGVTDSLAGVADADVSLSDPTIFHIFPECFI
jgi:hypothetical protein